MSRNLNTNNVPCMAFNAGVIERKASQHDTVKTSNLYEVPIKEVTANHNVTKSGSTWKRQNSRVRTNKKISRNTVKATSRKRSSNEQINNLSTKKGKDEKMASYNFSPAEVGQNQPCHEL